MYLYESDSLKHYGVLGMKWGIRKAEKRGETYTYESMSTKRYKRKAAKADKKAAKLDKKTEIYKQRAKRSAEHDRNMQKIAENESTSKTQHKYLLLGNIGAASYDRVKASGVHDKGKAIAAVLLGGPFAGYTAKSAYIRQDERQRR